MKQISVSTQPAITIESSRYSSPLGTLIVDCIDGGICRVQIGEADEETSRNAFLRTRGISSAGIQSVPMPRAIGQQLDVYFSGTPMRFTLPLRLFGTPFQELVWQQLQVIPYGTTATYHGIAERLGNPRAIRAVGAANGCNPAPVIVPCHRVIGANGDLTGYAYGIEIKQALLVLEGALLT